MSLLTQASLVLTPTAYKANKLYSVVPSNGNGDMVTTRATTATRVNSSGLVENVATGIPRLDYSDGTASLLLEPQRTNRLLNSATVVTQTISTTGVACTVSFYGTGTITFSGTYIGSLIGTGASNRVSLTFTPTAGSLILTVSGTCTNGQLETGSYPTSYIPTTTSTVTRNADLISLNNIYTNNLITSAGGTLFVEIDNNFSLVRDSPSYFGLQTSSILQTDGIVIKTAGGGFRLQVSKRVTNVETPIYITSTDKIKVAIKWNGTIVDIFVNGVKVTLIGSNSFTPTVMQYLNLTGSDVPKYVKSFILFPTPLTDAECATLTTL